MDGRLPGRHRTAPRPRAILPSHHPEPDTDRLAQGPIPCEKLPATPAGWPQDDDTITFARRLSGLTQQIYATYRDRHGPQFQAFGFCRERHFLQDHR